MNTPVTAETLLRDACNQERTAQYWENTAADIKRRSNDMMGYFTMVEYNFHVTNGVRGREAAARMLNEAIQLS